MHTVPFADDHEPYDHVNSHAQAHKATLQRKVAERKADLSAKQAQRARAEAECAELAARVAAQTYSKEDVVRMTAEK